MKKWKKWTALLCAGAMLVSLAACGTQSAGSDSMAAYAGQSVTGQITALDGTSVTLQLGELSQSDAMQPSDATPPEKPESDSSDDTAGQDAGTQSSDTTPPEKPEGDATGDAAAQAAGTQPSDMTPPEKPEGDATGDGSSRRCRDTAVRRDASRKNRKATATRPWTAAPRRTARCRMVRRAGRRLPRAPRR